MKGEVSQTQIAVIGDEDTLTAFRLGGVGRCYSEENPTLDLKAVLSDKSLGILIVTEGFARKNRNAIDRHRVSDARTPVVVEIPDIRTQATETENPIDRLVRQAVGAEIS